MGMRILCLWLEGGRLLLTEGYASKRLLVSALMESKALMYMMVDCYQVRDKRHVTAQALGSFRLKRRTRELQAHKSGRPVSGTRSNLIFRAGHPFSSGALSPWLIPAI